MPGRLLGMADWPSTDWDTWPRHARSSTPQQRHMMPQWPGGPSPCSPKSQQNGPIPLPRLATMTWLGTNFVEAIGGKSHCTPSQRHRLPKTHRRPTGGPDAWLDNQPSHPVTRVCSRYKQAHIGVVRAPKNAPARCGGVTAAHCRPSWSVGVQTMLAHGGSCSAAGMPRKAPPPLQGVRLVPRNLLSSGRLLQAVLDGTDTKGNIRGRQPRTHR